MVPAVVMAMNAGVMLGAHTIKIAVKISMILVALVKICAVVTPVLVGVMKLVPIMVIAVQIIVACVLIITENKLIEKPSKNLPKLLELTD